MKNGIEAMITDITATTAEAEDYTGEDGLLYCGKCHTPKEAYFAEGKTCLGVTATRQNVTARKPSVWSVKPPNSAESTLTPWRT